MQKERPTVLGEKQESPTNITTMATALKNLKNDTSMIRKFGQAFLDNISLQPNYRYIKFKPKTKLQLDALDNNDLLNVSALPLNYKVKYQGTYYRDPETPMHELPYRYAYIKNDVSLADSIAYQILDHYYVPDYFNPNILIPNNQYTEFTYFWVQEAFRINNQATIFDTYFKNFEIDSKRILKNGQNTNISYGDICFCLWKPRGKVRAYDKAASVYKPLGRAKVTFRTPWFLYSTTTSTSILGNFSSNIGFNTDVDCKIYFENTDYRIASSDFNLQDLLNTLTGGIVNVISNFLGINTSNTCYFGRNLDVNEGMYVDFSGPGSYDVYQYYASIYRAAYHYYYQNILDLSFRPSDRAPIREVFPKFSILAATSFNGGGLFLESIGAFLAQLLGIGNTMYIAEYNYNDDQRTYATSIHELGHAVHFYSNPAKFVLSQRVVQESWADGVEYALTNQIYGTRTANIFPTTCGTHKITLERYTPFIEDLIDGFKIRKRYSWNHNAIISYNDSVQGYTIGQIENALFYETTLEKWLERITRDNPSNPTKDNVKYCYLFWTPDNTNYGSLVMRCYTPRPIPPGVCPSCATPGRPIR
ncbi:MAG: hypothetical protein QM539_06125 [Alphaproteobacteria bacterium]|nr:hypothetical protein [Alphaproteobacteria bacterium]